MTSASATVLIACLMKKKALEIFFQYFPAINELTYKYKCERWDLHDTNIVILS